MDCGSGRICEEYEAVAGRTELGDPFMEYTFDATLYDDLESGGAYVIFRGIYARNSGKAA